MNVNSNTIGMSRNTNAEFSEGWTLVREITAADSGAKLIASDGPYPAQEDAIRTALAVTDRGHEPVGLFAVGSSKGVAIRAWAKTENTSGTLSCAARLFDFPHPGPRQQHSPASGAANAMKRQVTRAKGSCIFEATWTFGGSTSLNGATSYHPVTGEVDATYSYVELSATSYTYEQELRIKEFPDGSAASHEKIITVDPFGAALLYPEITTFGADVAGIIVAMRRID